MVATILLHPIFGLAFTFVILSYLVYTLRKPFKKQEPSAPVYQEPQNLWSPINFLIFLLRWYRDKSVTKPPLIDHVCSRLKYLSGQFSKPTVLKLFDGKVVLFQDDFESISKVLHSRRYLEKLPSNLNEILSGNRGFLWNNGPVWKELRKYTVKKLGQLGIGKGDQLSHILSDLVPDLLHLVESRSKETGNRIQIKNLFVLLSTNVLWCVIGGTKFSKNEEFYKLCKSIDIMGNFSFWKAYLITRLPNNNFINTIMGFKPMYESIKYLRDYCTELVNEKMKLSKSDQPKDFVEHFLLEIEKYKDNNELKHIYCKEELATVLADLLQAGMDTSGKYLEISLMYMILNPEVQRNVQEEIDCVIGKSMTPSSYYHRHRMPYACATMMEIHRMGSVLPVLGRYIKKAVTPDGHISEETVIMNMMWAVRMDKSYWGDPNSFRPERFLDEQNTLMMEKMNRVMPFGAGLRGCPGENVATATSFTFLMTILQNYTVVKAVQDEFLGIEKSCGTVTQTVPFHISLQTRF